MTNLGRATIAKAGFFRIACLHTAASNISVFDTAAETLDIAPGVIHHEVRADLLAAAELAGRLTEDIAESTALALCALARHADVVVLTCSTLGPSIERIAPDIQVPILRADEALAATAVRHGGKIVVLCAIETTLEPTTRLFHKAAQQSNAVVDVQLVPGAWLLPSQPRWGSTAPTIAQPTPTSTTPPFKRTGHTRRRWSGASRHCPSARR